MAIILIGITLFLLMAITLFNVYKRCVYWVQELSYNNSTNHLKVVVFKFNKEINFIESDLSEFEFILTALSGKSNFSYKICILQHNKVKVLQYQIAEWSKEKIEDCVKELHKAGALVTIKNLPIKIKEKVLNV